MFLRKMKFTVALLSTFLAAAACGDSGSGGGDSIGSALRSCEDALTNFSPCGGDLTGEWRMQLACMEGSEFFWSCSEATVAYRYGGQTIHFDGSLVTARNTVAAGVMETRIPVSCLEGATCSDLSQSGFMRCSGTDSCLCRMPMEPEEEEEEEEEEITPYTVDGSRLTIQSVETGEDVVNEFCVQGDTLYLYALDTEETEGISAIMVGTRIR